MRRIAQRVRFTVRRIERSSDRVHGLILGAGVSFVERLIQVPVVEFEAADTQRMLAALTGARDESVERY